MIQDCQQLAIDNNWSLTRTNACHIGNTNEEMGEVSVHMREMSYLIKNIGFKQSCIFGVFGAISLCILGVLIKRYFKS